MANCRRTALHVCVPNTKPGAARRGRRGGAAPVLAAVENCEAVCRLVGWRRMRGAWDAWCCYNYPSFKGIVRDPKLSLNSLPLGGPSSSLKTQREKRVTAFAACPEKRKLSHPLLSSDPSPVRRVRLRRFFLSAVSKRLTSLLAFARCSSGSHELYSEGQPAHLTK